jgi:hypothetical protein
VEAPEQEDATGGIYRQLGVLDTVKIVPIQELDALAQLDLKPLAVWHVDRHFGPIALEDALGARRFQDRGGVEVDHQAAATALGCPEEGHHAVNVLGRGVEEDEALGGLEFADEALL